MNTVSLAGYTCSCARIGGESFEFPLKSQHRRIDGQSSGKDVGYKFARTLSNLKWA